MLSTAAYGGKRLHKGEIVSDAVWPALIEFETWERLQALMSPKSRRRTNDWPAAHLLAGIAICSVCGAPLRVGRQNAGKRTLDDSSTVERKTYLTYVCLACRATRPRRQEGLPRWDAQGAARRGRNRAPLQAP